MERKPTKIDKIEDHVIKNEPIGKGSDSRVFKYKTEKGDIVLKKYDKLKEKFGKAEAEKILRDYYADTERAQEILLENPNPLNQKIKIEGVEYDFHYKIVPQGGVLLEADSFYSISEKTPIVAGQKFADGLNYDQLNNSQLDSKKLKEMTSQQKIFYHTKESNENIYRNCIELFDFLNEKLKTTFNFVGLNMKPHLNIKEKKLEIIITDLAGSLDLFNDGTLIRNYENKE